MLEMFEYASRNKLRYPSVRGDLTTEDLWSVPLTSRDGFNLDEIAKGVNRALRSFEEESFVAAKPSNLVRRVEVTMEIVKHVINVKLEQQVANAQRALRNEKRERLIAVLADKEQQSLQELTPEQIREKLRELDEEVQD